MEPTLSSRNIGGTSEDFSAGNERRTRPCPRVISTYRPRSVLPIFEMLFTRIGEKSSWKASLMPPWPGHCRRRGNHPPLPSIAIGCNMLGRKSLQARYFQPWQVCTTPASESDPPFGDHGGVGMLIADPEATESKTYFC